MTRINQSKVSHGEREAGSAKNVVKSAGKQTRARSLSSLLSEFAVAFAQLPGQHSEMLIQRGRSVWHCTLGLGEPKTDCGWVTYAFSLSLYVRERGAGQAAAVSLYFRQTQDLQIENNYRIPLQDLQAGWQTLHDKMARHELPPQIRFEASDYFSRLKRFRRLLGEQLKWS